VSVASIVAGALLSNKIGQLLSYYLLSDSNKILAVACGFSGFMFFKNLKIKNSKVINTISSTTFGILLIHANGDSMRKWLWGEVLKNCEYFDSKYIALHAIISCLIVFILCSIIDLIRQKTIGKVCLKIWNKIEPSIVGCYKKVEEKIFKLLHIGDDK
jgi:hypothetical protein